MDLRVGSLPKVRILPNPEGRLRTLVERAPQAEAWANRMMQELRPYMTMLYDIRRRIATGAIAALAIWLFVHVTFGANGMVVYQEKKGEYQSLQKEIHDLQQENDRSSQQIKALETDPKSIEKEAREQLHYARPGEVIYVSPPTPPAPPSPQSKVARK